ncbi:hypothetical protein B0H19DRAFT_1079082 [Mycena capillaripes]|nr:hypothetical protein B0H19DRAFT_1079082 [Mycena capillaripes]
MSEGPTLSDSGLSHFQDTSTAFKLYLNGVTLILCRPAVPVGNFDAVPGLYTAGCDLFALSPPPSSAAKIYPINYQISQKYGFPTTSDPPPSNDLTKIGALSIPPPATSATATKTTLTDQSFRMRVTAVDEVEPVECRPYPPLLVNGPILLEVTGFPTTTVLESLPSGISGNPPESTCAV